jgi:tetratricopeptide (TPR) repeat protein
MFAHRQDVDRVGMSGAEIRNELPGSAGQVVQAGSIGGDVHFHSAPADTLVIPRQLPPDVSPWCDRVNELSGLHRWLETPGTRAATVIMGFGGVGKTSLVAHWAHGVRERFPDGDLYLDLRGYHSRPPLTAGQALDEILRALGMPDERIPAELDAKTSLYRSMLHDRRMLIVLDNAASVEQVRPLLPGCADCRVLITTRGALTGLIVREGARPMPLDVLPPDQAVKLLGDLVGDDRLADEPEATATLARYCGCLPLALRIVAMRLTSSYHLTAADLVEELAETRERLDVLATDDEYANVRAVFSWSYRALAHAAARLFRLLGLPTGMDIDVAALAALADLSAAEVKKLVGVLVGAHLLEESGPRRYRMHDLLRVYAAECATAEESPESANAAIVRLLNWYLYAVVAAVTVFGPHFQRLELRTVDPDRAPPTFADDRRALQWCDRERDNLMAAVTLAADTGECELGWQIPRALFGYFIVRKCYPEWTSATGIGVACAQRVGDRAAEAWLRTSLLLSQRSSKPEVVVAQYDDVIAVWREVGDRWGEAWALRDVGVTYNLLGRFQEAAETLERALAIQTELGDEAAESTTLRDLAGPYRALGRLVDAQRSLERALTIRRALGNQRLTGQILDELSQLYGDQGRLAEAIDVGDQAIAIFAEIGHRHEEAAAHEHLAETLTGADRVDDADPHLLAALAVYESARDPRAERIRRQRAVAGLGPS